MSNDGSYMFTTVYVLLGVPLNGFLWGLWADWVLEPYVAETYIYYLPQKHPRIFVRLMQWLARARETMRITMAVTKAADHPLGERAEEEGSAA